MIIPSFQVNATSYEPSNVLIVRAPESIQIQIQKILEVIDNPKNTKSLEIIKLNYSSASDVSLIIQNVINYKYKNNPGISIGEPKTNKLIILEEPKNLIELKNIIKDLDNKSISSNNVVLNKLKNAKSDQIGNILNQIK